MRTRVLGAVLLVAAASAACGPIIGQAMKSSAGLKDFQVTEGSLEDFRAVRTVLVAAPFRKSGTGYFICRGEDEAALAEGLAAEGVYEAEFHVWRDPDEAPAALAALRSRSPSDIQGELGLRAPPEGILTGEILARDETVAPTVGVLQDLRLRLELYELRSRRSATLEIAVRSVHRDAIPDIVRELRRRIRPS